MRMSASYGFYVGMCVCVYVHECMNERLSLTVYLDVGLYVVYMYDEERKGVRVAVG